MRFAKWVCPLTVLLPVLTMGVGVQALRAQGKRETQKQKTLGYGFKEYRIGMKFDDLEPTVGRYDGDELQQQGGFQDTIAEEDCFVFLTFEDYGKGLQLDYIGVTAAKSAFSAIASALKAKYGQPATARVVTKKNAMGASFSGREFIWVNAVSTLRAEEIGDKIDECRIVWAARGLGSSRADKAKRSKAASDI